MCDSRKTPLVACDAGPRAHPAPENAKASRPHRPQPRKHREFSSCYGRMPWIASKSSIIAHSASRHGVTAGGLDGRSDEQARTTGRQRRRVRARTLRDDSGEASDIRDLADAISASPSTVRRDLEHPVKQSAPERADGDALLQRTERAISGRTSLSPRNCCATKGTPSRPPSPTGCGADRALRCADEMVACGIAD